MVSSLRCICDQHRPHRTAAQPSAPACLHTHTWTSPAPSAPVPSTDRLHVMAGGGVCPAYYCLLSCSCMVFGCQRSCLVGSTTYLLPPQQGAARPPPTSLTATSSRALRDRHVSRAIALITRQPRPGGRASLVPYTLTALDYRVLVTPTAAIHHGPFEGPSAARLTAAYPRAASWTGW